MLLFLLCCLLLSSFITYQLIFFFTFIILQFMKLFYLPILSFLLKKHVFHVKPSILFSNIFLSQQHIPHHLSIYCSLLFFSLSLIFFLHKLDIEIHKGHLLTEKSHELANQYYSKLEHFIT